MWPYSKKIAALEARIAFLEKKDYTPMMFIPTAVRKDGDSSILWCFDNRRNSIPVAEAIFAILNHLGIELKRTEPEGSRVVVEKKTQTLKRQ